MQKNIDNATLILSLLEANCNDKIDLPEDEIEELVDLLGHILLSIRALQIFYSKEYSIV